MHSSDKHGKLDTGTIAYGGLLLCVALILSYVEAVIPVPVGIPGVKLGLPNLAVVLLLYTKGSSMALIINILRILLSGFMFGNMYSIAYSLAGGLFSFAVMAFGKRSGFFGTMGVSLLGGVFHNIGQLFMAGITLQSTGLVYYLPVLMVSGAVTGIVIGKVTDLVMPVISGFNK